MNTENEKVVFGLDEGAGALKVWSGIGGSQLLSMVATDGSMRSGRMAGMKKRKPPMRLTTADGDFYVGPGSHDVGRPVDNLDHSRFSGSPELKALSYGAMSLHLRPARQDQVIDTLVVGLPIETLIGDQADRTSASVREWMQGEHAWTVTGGTWGDEEMQYSVTVNTCRVTSQPVGAWADALMDISGEWLPERLKMKKQEVGVLSIGMNTIETLVVKDRVPMERFTSGNTMGVRRLLELCDSSNLYSRGELDTQLRDGTLDYRAALRVWTSDVRGIVESSWSRAWRRFAAVVVVGGGAVLLRDEMMRLFGSKMLLVNDPVLATARGLYKLARRSAR